MLHTEQTSTKARIRFLKLQLMNTCTATVSLFFSSSLTALFNLFSYLIAGPDTIIL